MSFSHFWIFHLLWLLPVTVFALVIRNRQRKRGLECFADPDLLDRLKAEERRGVVFIKDILLLVSLASMLVALAGPRWGSHYQEVSRKGVDIMLVVDVSKSMLAEDVKPDRIERARREIIDLLHVVQGDRIGLVAFAGTAYVHCPLTLDYAALEMFLDEIRPDLIPVPGTDMGAAIDTAVAAFDEKSNADRVIILVTDGEDNEGKGVAAARRAASKGVKIFVFGIGDVSGSPIPASGGKGGFVKDKNGNLVLSRLDEKGLKEIATITGGSYVRSVTGDLDLDILYFEGIKSHTKDTTLKSGKIVVHEERFPLFVLAAFFFLFLEGVLDEYRRRAPSSRITSFMLLFLVLFNCSSPAMCAEDLDKLYREGRFSEAEKGYIEKDMENPKDIRYRYNRGCAAYQASNFDSAEAAFSSVMRRTKDKEMLFRAAYNLGNTAFKKGDFVSAVSFFKQAIIYNPKNADARYNLELALRELKKQEKGQKEKESQKEQKGREGEKEKKEKSGHKPGPDSDSDRKEDSRPNTDTKDDEKGERQSGENMADKNDNGQPSQGKREGGIGKETRKPRDASLAAIDRKKAEAMLDNVKEDRSRFLRFRVPKDEGPLPGSGKVW